MPAKFPSEADSDMLCLVNADISGQPCEETPTTSQVPFHLLSFNLKNNLET